jgi:ferredoxin
MNGWGPVEIERDSAGAVMGVRFRRCLRVYDEDRRFAPRFDDQHTEVVACDTVLLAVGQATNLDFLGVGGEDIAMLRPGWPRVAPDTLATTAPDVFVAGDLAHGTRLVIDAVASGKAAARSVYRHLTGRALEPEAVSAHLVLDDYHREPGYEAIRRVPVPTREPRERLAHPGVTVEAGYAREAAMREASRCLDCGVTPVFDGARCVLCGGCVDVCPTLCLALVGLDAISGGEPLHAASRAALGPDADPAAHSAILKDEDRCIRCALCAMRCPTDAITMERVRFATAWRSP